MPRFLNMKALTQFIGALIALPFVLLLAAIVLLGLVRVLMFLLML